MPIVPRRTLLLLDDLKSHYNHPWPGEDDATKTHRLEMLLEIKAVMELIYPTTIIVSNQNL